VGAWRHATGAQVSRDPPPVSGRDPATTEERRASSSGFTQRVFLVLLRPTTFWEELQQDSPSIGAVLYPHVVLLVLLRACAALAGNVLRHVNLGAAIGQFVTSFVAWIMMVFLFTLVAGSIASSRDSRVTLGNSFRFAAYGLTPLFLVGILAVIPIPFFSPIADLLLMPYTFLVLARGVVPFLGVPVDRAPSVVGLVCGATVVLWSLMPGLASVVLGLIWR
jgi:hypothetical protein